MHPPKTPPQLALGPPKAPSVPFFCLLCLNNYSKIFQKRRISKLLLRGTHMGYPPWGGPPWAPRAPPGVPGCQKVLEKIAKILKKYIKNLHASKYPKFKLKHLFWATCVIGGGAQNARFGFLKSSRVFFQPNLLIFSPNGLYQPPEQLWGGGKCRFWNCPVIITPYL